MALNLSWGGRSDDEHAGNMIKAKVSKAMIAMIAMIAMAFSARFFR